MRAYNQADQHLHVLCQVIGKANRSYVPEESDESHTNLYFDPWGNKILGRWIQSSSGNVLFALDLNTLAFDILDASREKTLTVSSIGKTEAIEAQALDQWKHMRKLANQTCFDFLGYAQAESEVRIWPKHFDTGIYFEYAGNIGIGFGLAMEDSMVGEPYFYMAGYPKNDPMIFENVPESPTWKWELGEHWKGAILPLSVIEMASYSQNEKTLSEYFMQNFNWYVNQDAGTVY